MKSLLRFCYNTFRHFLIRNTRILSDRLRNVCSNGKIAILNLQYVNSFTEIEMLCGVALKKAGYEVKAIICPGLEYCEREDYQTKRPNCKTCRKETLKLCKAYGVEVLTPKNNVQEYQSGKVFNKFSIPLNELVYRNYVHFKKSFTELDHLTWQRIERSVIKLADYISNLECEFSKAEKIITANGRFFQTALPLQLIKTKSGFITTEVFNDHKVVFGCNTYSLNNEIEVNEDTLRALEYDSTISEEFIRSEGRTDAGGIQVWGSDRIENLESVKKELKTAKYKEVLVFFPNVIWDSTWFGLGHFCHSPASFIPLLNSLAKKFPDILFVIRAHPGEDNVPLKMKASASIFSDLSCKHVKFESNVIFISSSNQLSSYKIGEIANYIILWNGTLGLEFAAKGKGVFSIADSYYEKFEVVRKLNSICDLEKALQAREIFTPTDRDIEVANRVLYASRNLKRIRSPIHKYTFCTKFFWNAVTEREKKFIRFFPEYFEEKINIYQLHNALNSKRYTESN